MVLGIVLEMVGTGYGAPYFINFVDVQHVESRWHDQAAPICLCKARVSRGDDNKRETRGMENITVSGATPAGSSISTVISWPSMTGNQYVRASSLVSPAARLRARVSMISWPETSNTCSERRVRAGGSAASDSASFRRRRSWDIVIVRRIRYATSVLKGRTILSEDRLASGTSTHAMPR